MTKNLFILSLVLLTFNTSCSDKPDEEAPQDLNEALEDLNDEIAGPVWSIKTDGDLYEIEIPSQMKEMDELNPVATLEYGYTEHIGGEAKENYVIVIPHLISELKEETPDYDYNVENYSDLSIITLMQGKSSYEVINDVATEQINGMPAMVHEIEASIEVSDSLSVDAYYMLGVFEGEKAFYQVLLWTVLNQKDDFRGDMRHMVYSFSEIGTDNHVHADGETEVDHSTHNH